MSEWGEHASSPEGPAAETAPAPGTEGSTAVPQGSTRRTAGGRTLQVGGRDRPLLPGSLPGPSAQSAWGHTAQKQREGPMPQDGAPPGPQEAEPRGLGRRTEQGQDGHSGPSAGQAPSLGDVLVSPW